MLFPLVRGTRVCHFSCKVTDAVLILWWLLCCTVSVISTEVGKRYSPKRRVALCVVTVEQTLLHTV